MSEISMHITHFHAFYKMRLILYQLSNKSNLQLCTPSVISSFSKLTWSTQVSNTPSVVSGMHIPFHYVCEYLLVLECGQYFLKIEHIYMHKCILNKHLISYKRGPGFFNPKFFAYKSEFIFSMWKCPSIQKQEFIQENRPVLEVQGESCFITWKIWIFCTCENVFPAPVVPMFYLKNKLLKPSG